MDARITGSNNVSSSSPSIGAGARTTRSKLSRQESNALLVKYDLVRSRPGQGRSLKERLTGVAPTNDEDAASTDEGEPQCSPEQQIAIDAALDPNTRAVFITGGAGVGKSFIVHKIVSLLREQGRRVAVTASTGIAAVNVNGTTVHKFGGIGLCQDPIDEIVRKILRWKGVKKRWLETEVLLIDEISMLDANVFDTLDYVGKVVRRQPSLPFGGMKIILVGDFFQMPPVKADAYVFESTAWAKMDIVKIKLERVWRQRDPDFVHLLRELRLGSISDENFAKLEACNRPLDVSDDILPTKLYPHRVAVDSENKKFFDQLEGNAISYGATNFKGSKLSRDKSIRKRLDQETDAPPVVETKLRMQVLLRTNLDVDAGLCNGSRGVLIGYESFRKWLAKLDDWGTDLSKYGGRTRLESFANENGAYQTALPVVLFANGEVRTIGPQLWERTDVKENPSPKATKASPNASQDKKPPQVETISRLQIPLIPAWALTIHKCQGMSLDRVHINLSNSFGHGMIYVALSRVRSLQGLRLEGFDRNRVSVNQKVLAFYQDADGASESAHGTA